MSYGAETQHVATIQTVTINNNATFAPKSMYTFGYPHSSERSGCQLQNLFIFTDSKQGAGFEMDQG